MNKKYLIIGLVVIIAIGIYFAIQKSRDSANNAKEVTTELAKKRDIAESVTASGKIYTEEEVKISSDVSGEIIELYIKEGQFVEKGTLLAKIQPESYQAMVDQSDAQYNNALANLKNMQANYSNSVAREKQVAAQLDNAQLAFNRAKELYSTKSISTAELEQAETNFKTAKAEVEAASETIKGAKYSIEGAQATIKGAQATIRDAKSNLIKTSIFAPISGTISLLNVEKGEKVLGTLQMTGTEIMRISNFNNMEVRVDVSESEIIKVKLGDTTDVEIDAYIGRKFKGIVTQVSNTSKGSSDMSLTAEQSSNFVVKVRILDSSYADLTAEGKKPFLPGMSATVDIFTKRENQVIALPIQSVVTREDSITKDIQEVVFKDSNGYAIQTNVKTGIQDDTYIQILEGVKVGDKIITGPYDVLSKTLKDKGPIKEKAKDK
jgi:HlyD family secretion protein